MSAPERRIMQIEKMPLDDRLARMLNGYSAYTEYIPCVLRSFASMPVSVYLAPYEGQWERLCALLGITEVAGKDRMTYQETAARIYQGWTENRQDLSMAEAIYILSIPFRDYFEGRDGTHGKSKSDAS